jgi:4-hydroxythreonine-4-phosphate dehydrogenase
MPISQSNKPIVVLTMGDPAGIGPEIILRSLSKPFIRKLASYIIVGDIKILQKTATYLGRFYKAFLNRVQVISDRSLIFRKRVYAIQKEYVALLDLDNVSIRSFVFGKERGSYGKASVEYIKRAYGLVKANIADCIVTAPISKTAVQKAGFKFPGHTEYFAAVSGVKKFAMMLVGGPFRISLVTRHLPLREVSRHLSSRNICDTIKLTLDTLQRDFGIEEPKIGVCSLNPHSGEGGIFGREESKVIAPAVKRFSRTKVVGPIPADALFYDAYRGRFDGLICLYHDQGLIPLKMIARDRGGNVTLGLSFVRTSPAHGTAFDIAWKGIANSCSMEMAIRLAISIVRNRKNLSFTTRCCTSSG